MRMLIRFILIVVVVVGLGALALGWWAGSSMGRRVTTDERPIGTAGSQEADRARERAREIGADAGERAAVAGARAKEELTEAGITARIKAKMALDDLVKARTIDVTTEGSTVTLAGTVGSDAERERAERLARETEGVAVVTNRLEVRR